METTYTQIIKETVSEFLEKLGFSASVIVEREREEDNTFVCKVQVNKDQNFLIGQYGANLSALQHLIRVILHKQIADTFSIIVDVNDYFLEKRVLLEKEAEGAMKEALDSNASVALRPMLPYERKVIHSFLAKYSTVRTESVGRGDDRKVMISPRSDEHTESSEI